MTIQYATFEVGGQYLGIRVLEVREVLREQQVTRVPLAPPVVAGLINVRGQIIPALELRRLLHLPGRNESEGTLSVVLQTETGPASLQVDEIADVVEIDSANVRTPPLSLDPEVRRCLSGVCPMKGRLLLILDIPRVVGQPTLAQPPAESH